jgi:serine/threonine protein kinase
MADRIEPVNADELLGQVLDGRYRVDAVLGMGGFGMVFRGLQTSMGRPIALKTLHPQLAAAPAFFERFKREAEIASRLKHPNIITIYDFGRTPDGICYFVMEYLEGESLRERVRRDGPLTLRNAAAIVEQVALGLSHAHHQGVIHRDVKPHNIMLSEVDGEEYVKLLDFGLVKAMEAEGEEQLTSTGQVLGTPQYMPPEQAGGDEVDERSDLYSLTGVLHFCLTGRSPYGANSVGKALSLGLAAALAPLNTQRQGAPVPDALDRFLEKGLSPEKDDRFQSAEELVASLHAALTGAPDTVLDAVPIFVPDQKEGSGSSSRAQGSRPRARAVTVASRPLPRSATRASQVAVRPAPEPASRTGLFVAVVGVGLAAVALATYLALKPAAQAGVPPAASAPRAAQAETRATVVDPPAPALQVTLDTTPTNAEVFEDGVLVGRTPLLIADWKKGQTRTLAFRLAGFREIERALRPEASGPLAFTLEAVAPRPTPLPPRRPGKRKDDPEAFE